jgi:hypothetical protein
MLCGLTYNKVPGLTFVYLKTQSPHGLPPVVRSNTTKLPRVVAYRNIIFNLKNVSVPGKFCPALTSLHRMPVLRPRGQWPSRVYHRVSGDVKLQRKKSDTVRAKMNAFLGLSL